MSPLLTGDTKIVRQVINYRKTFGIGYLHPIRGKITTLPADRGILGLGRGLSKVMPSLNGSRPDRVHCYGFTANVCIWHTIQPMRLCRN